MSLRKNLRVDEDELNDNAVTLTTVHAAKGLEFPFVFLIGMEHNIFPHERSVNEGGLEEELRLFYVAITRAKKNLIMTHSGRRMRNGKFKNSRPSEFLSSLPGEHAEWIEKGSFFRAVEKDDVLDGFANIFSMLNDND
jgi:superfamily I DNA/RNA helicase